MARASWLKCRENLAACAKKKAGSFEPAFNFLAIGSLGADPSAPNRIWVGTGENHGGRHNGFGDGIYKSDDGGATWEKKGLDASEHISKIIVHPDDSNTVWVASQGPLWSPGGERGVSKRSMVERHGRTFWPLESILAPPIY